MVSLSRYVFAMASALALVSIDLQWHTQYLNLALVVFIFSYTGPKHGLELVCHSRKASLASKWASFT